MSDVDAEGLIARLSGRLNPAVPSRTNNANLRASSLEEGLEAGCI